MTKQPPWEKVNSMRMWLAPGMGVKRHVLVAVGGGISLVFGVMLVILWGFAGDRELLSDPIENVLVSPIWELWGIWLAVLLIGAGIIIMVAAIARLNRSLLSHWLDRPSDAAEVLFQELKLSKGPRIVAPGDLSDCLAALSDRDQELGKLLQFRFDRGDELQGHTFGNLLITTLTEVQGDFGEAIDALNSLLDLKGRVYPAATKAVSLVATKVDGTEVRGESALRDSPGPVESVRIEPSDVAALPRVAAQIGTADAIVLGPGSLFSSTIPPLLVEEIGEALRAARGPIVYVCNIMTEAGETDGMSAFEHVSALHAHLGKWPDVVVMNGQPLDEARRAAYELENAAPVMFAPEKFESSGVRYVLLDLISAGEQAYHDSEMLAEWLLDYARQQQSEGWARARKN